MEWLTGKWPATGDRFVDIQESPSMGCFGNGIDTCALPIPPFKERMSLENADTSLFRTGFRSVWRKNN